MAAHQPSKEDSARVFMTTTVANGDGAKGDRIFSNSTPLPSRTFSITAPNFESKDHRVLPHLVDLMNVHILLRVGD